MNPSFASIATVRSVVAVLIGAIFLIGLPVGRPSAAEEAAGEAEAGLQLNASERDWLATRPDVRLGDDFLWPPFAFMDEKGVYGGISSGYVASVSKRLGITIRPVPGLTWAQVLEKLKRGEIDMLPAVVRSKQREAFLNFTKPYITFPVVIASHRDGFFISGLTDLAGHKAGVVKGYITHELLEKDHPDIKLVLFDSLTAGLNALESRAIDAFIDNLGAVTYEARRLRLANVKIAASTSYKFELSMAVRKDWPELVSLLDKSLEAMSSQEKSAIENTWLAVEVHFGVDVKTILLWVMPTGLSATLVIVVVVVWNRRLNHEIAVRKQTEAQLVAANRQLAEQARQLETANTELKQFAYAASHDLRAPLRVVTNYLGLIVKRLGPSLDEDTREFVGFAVDGAKRMDAMIVGLLEYSRTGHTGNPFVPTPLADVVQESLDNLQVSIQEAGAVVEVAKGLPSVAGDRSELVRLFQNLIGNAVKFRVSGRTTKVTVDWRDAGSEWVAWIHDNGIGIDPKDVECIFQVFKRLVSVDQYEGSGIGLAVCKKIIERHGGRIWVESVPGEGSTFLIAFPKTESIGVEATDHNQRPPGNSP
ncbi:MAG: transporter substrate-binding domain-containing protein [Alphaproteobacteria bacterium]|nr:transporter substrate-binding domain-containing protein [Alphaproteobacteria bacterium]